MEEGEELLDKAHGKIVQERQLKGDSLELLMRKNISDCGRIVSAEDNQFHTNTSSPMHICCHILSYRQQNECRPGHTHTGHETGRLTGIEKSCAADWRQKRFQNIFLR